MPMAVSALLASLFSYKSPPTRLRPTAWLDGLRGVAALEVVIYHYAELWGAIDLGYSSTQPGSETILRLPLVRTLYDSGAAMVCLFFIISGLVLTQRILQALGKGEVLGAFSIISSSVLRRGLRLFPPAVMSAFISFLLFRIFKVRPYGAHPDFVPYFDTFLEQLYDWLAETIRYINPFDSNLRDGWTVVDGRVRFLGHAYANVIWTIPVEYYGSMACYLQLVATAHLPKKTRNLVLGGIALWGLLVSRWILFCFNAGILLGQWLLDESSITRPTTTTHHPATAAWSLAMFAGLYLAGSPDRGSGPGANPSLGFNTIWTLVPERHFNLNFNYTVWSIAGVLIATSASQLSGARKVLESGASQYLGKISFSMYLLHIIVRDVFGELLKTVLLTEERLRYNAPDDGTPQPWMARYAACMIWYVVMLVLVFICSGIFERFIDAPLIRFSKWVEVQLLSQDKSKNVVSLDTLESQRSQD